MDVAASSTPTAIAEAPEEAAPAKRSPGHLVLAPTIAAFIFLPWARDLSQLASAFSAGLLFLLAIFTPRLMAPFLASAHPGELPPGNVARLAIRQLAFQVVLFLTLAIPILAAGTLNLSRIALGQGGGFTRWLIFHDPFNSVAFFLAIIAVHGAIAARPALEPLFGRQAPLLAGPSCGLILFLLAALQTALWLGAWYDPFHVIAHLELLSHDAVGITRWNIAVAADALGVVVFLGKAWLLYGVQRSLLRNLPRYRFAEILQLGFIFLLPAATCNFLAAAGYLWLVEPLPMFQRAMRVVLAVVVTLGAMVGAMLMARAGSARTLRDSRVLPDGNAD